MSDEQVRIKSGGRLVSPGLIQVGSLAPDFSMTDVFGAPVSLFEPSDGYTLLVFLRYSGCPWCNLTIHRLTMEHKLLQKNNCRVIAFVQSEPESVKRNVFDRHDPRPPFSVIADSDREVYAQYGVRSSVTGTLGQISKIPFWLQSVYSLGFKQKKLDGDLFLVPAMFLVNIRTRKVVKASEGVNFYDHSSFTPIYDALNFKD